MRGVFFAEGNPDLANQPHLTMKFDPADIRSIIEQHEKIREEDEFRAMEIAEAAARFTMIRTECTLDELQTALKGDYEKATATEQDILMHFYHFMDEAQN